MSDLFEQLKKIAKEEFGVELVQGQSKLSFKELFGFDSCDLIGLDGIENETSRVFVDFNAGIPNATQLKDEKIAQFNSDFASLSDMTFAA